MFKLAPAHVRDLVSVVPMTLKDVVVAALESQEVRMQFLPRIFVKCLIHRSNQSALDVASTNFVLQRLNRAEEG